MKTFIKNKWIGWAGGVLVLLVGATWVVRSRSNSKTTTVEVVRGDVVEAVYGIGTVTANKSFVLKVAISTNIRNVFVREGDFVKRGQPLVQMDETLQFRAPFEGTVTDVAYRVGETVTPQTPVLSLLDMNDRYVLVSLEQLGAVRIKRGQRAKLNFEGQKGETYSGNVEAVYAKGNSFMARISGENLPANILPGMTLDVAIEVGERRDVMLVPISALSRNIVTRFKGNRREKVEVKTGLVDGQMIEITEGNLSEGDLVEVEAKVEAKKAK